MFRHAVDAAEVAAIGDRNAQIGNRALERIDQCPSVSAQGDQVQLSKRRVPLLSSIAWAGSLAHNPYIGILADIDDSVQNLRAFLRSAPGKGRAEVIDEQPADLLAKAMMASGSVRLSSEQGREPPQLSVVLASLPPAWPASLPSMASRVKIRRRLGWGEVSAVHRRRDRLKLLCFGVILTREGLSPLDYDRARNLVGGGAKAMIARGLEAEGRPCPPTKLEKLFADFIAHYSEHLTERSQPFPGVDVALDAR